MSSHAQKSVMFSPLIDFLMVGGLAAVCLPILMLIPHTEANMAAVGGFALFMAAFVNHPHFANSYQILYKNYGSKISDETVPKKHRNKMIWAGIISPIILGAYCVYAFTYGSKELLGYSINAMFILVGWHYVKQGYGILMVFSAREKYYFTEVEKKPLLINSYCAWLAAFAAGNGFLNDDKYLGIKYYTFEIPAFISYVLFAALIFTTLWSVYAIVKRYKATKQLPSVNGMIGYVSAVYIWIFIRWIDVMMLLVVPLFHSLQYLLFVWKFKFNEIAAQNLQPSKPFLKINKQMWWFIIGGFILGILGFYALPVILWAFIDAEQKKYTTIMFVVTVWMFINVHHYFIDNAIWKRENKDMKYLSM